MGGKQRTSKLHVAADILITNRYPEDIITENALVHLFAPETVVELKRAKCLISLGDRKYKIDCDRTILLADSYASSAAEFLQMLASGEIKSRITDKLEAARHILANLSGKFIPAEVIERIHPHTLESLTSASWYSDRGGPQVSNKEMLRRYIQRLEKEERGAQRRQEEEARREAAREEARKKREVVSPSESLAEDSSSQSIHFNVDDMRAAAIALSRVPEGEEAPESVLENIPEQLIDQFEERGLVARVELSVITDLSAIEEFLVGSLDGSVSSKDEDVTEPEAGLPEEPEPLADPDEDPSEPESESVGEPQLPYEVLTVSELVETAVALKEGSRPNNRTPEEVYGKLNSQALDVLELYGVFTGRGRQAAIRSEEMDLFLQGVEGGKLLPLPKEEELVPGSITDKEEAKSFLEERKCQANFRVGRDFLAVVDSGILAELEAEGNLVPRADGTATFYLEPKESAPSPEPEGGTDVSEVSKHKLQNWAKALLRDGNDNGKIKREFYEDMPVDVRKELDRLHLFTGDGRSAIVHRDRCEMFLRGEELPEVSKGKSPQRKGKSAEAPLITDKRQAVQLMMDNVTSDNRFVKTEVRDKIAPKTLDQLISEGIISEKGFLSKTEVKERYGIVPGASPSRGSSKKKRQPDASATPSESPAPVTASEPEASESAATEGNGYIEVPIRLDDYNHLLHLGGCLKHDGTCHVSSNTVWLYHKSEGAKIFALGFGWEDGIHTVEVDSAIALSILHHDGIQFSLDEDGYIVLGGVPLAIYPELPAEVDED